MADIAGVILAAGESSRMGKNKAFLEVEGRSFLQWIAEAFADISPVVVVVSPEASGTLHALPEPFMVAVNPNPEMGMFSSLRVGLTALAEAEARADAEAETPTGAVLITPVDCPIFSKSTVDRMITHHQRLGGSVVPTFQGLSGHPVLLDDFLCQMVLDTDNTGRLDVLLSRQSRHCFHIEVGDPGILLDVDTPEDFNMLQRHMHNGMRISTEAVPNTKRS